jgi:hypothetical protein
LLIFVGIIFTKSWILERKIVVSDKIKGNDSLTVANLFLFGCALVGRVFHLVPASLETFIIILLSKEMFGSIHIHIPVLDVVGWYSFCAPSGTGSIVW